MTQDVVQHRARGDGGALGHPGDLLPPGGRIDLGEVDGAAGNTAVGHDSHPPPVRGQQAEEDLRRRGLARTRRTGQRHQAARRDRGAEPGGGPRAPGGDGYRIELNRR